jgi:hypothetical protein
MAVRVRDESMKGRLTIPEDPPEMGPISIVLREDA